MNNIIINGKQDFMGKNIPVVLGGFGEGKKCVSDKLISEVHDMRTVDVRRRITENINRFREHVDYIDVLEGVHQAHTLETLVELGYSHQSITQAEHIYLLSERGYAKLIKIMDSDLAWEIHDKLIDEYFQLREGINIDGVSTELKAIIMQDKKIQQIENRISVVNNDLQSFKEDMPILGIEESKITSAVRKKGVSCLGGKESEAYADRSLRSRVYADIYSRLKREFGVTSYKAIKRNQCEVAISIIESHEIPLVLAEEIVNCNSQMRFQAC